MVVSVLLIKGILDVVMDVLDDLVEMGVVTPVDVLVERLLAASGMTIGAP